MMRSHEKNFNDVKVDSAMGTKLSNHNIYRVQNQNDFLKQLPDLLKVKPELINQDVLPIIREL